MENKYKILLDHIKVWCFSFFTFERLVCARNRRRDVTASTGSGERWPRPHAGGGWQQQTFDRLNPLR